MWRPYGGAFAGTAALEHLLAHAGVAPEDPPWAEVLPRSDAGSESLLLGLGGVGFSFNLYPGPWGLHLALGFTRPVGSGVFQREVCKRLGVRVEIEETGNAALGGRALRQRAEAERPVLLWGSKAALPHMGLREELAPVIEHLWVVTGLGADRERYRVADLAPGPLELSVDEVAAARTALFTAKHRRLTVVAQDEGRGEPRHRDPRRLLRDVVTGTLDSLTEPLLPSQGLPGMARWADALEDTDSPRGWVWQLSTGARLFDVLTAMFRTVRLETGGALRGLWADFLHAAQSWTPVPALSEAAERYCDLAGNWRELADAALPEGGVPELAAARRLLIERDRRFRREGWERGGDSAERLEQLDRELEEIRRGLDGGTGLSCTRSRELMADLASRIRRIYRDETRAAEALQAALDPLEKESV